MGEDLAAFSGGVNQGVNLTQTAGQLSAIGPIHSAGGWAQLVARPIERVSLSAGGGIDSPLANDLPTVGGPFKYNPIGQNLAFYASAGYDLGAGFLVSLEYDYLHTKYQSGAAPTASIVALDAQFSF